MLWGLLGSWGCLHQRPAVALGSPCGRCLRKPILGGHRRPQGPEAWLVLALDLLLQALGFAVAVLRLCMVTWRSGNLGPGGIVTKPSDFPKLSSLSAQCTCLPAFLPQPERLPFRWPVGHRGGPWPSQMPHPHARVQWGNVDDALSRGSFWAPSLAGTELESAAAPHRQTVQASGLLCLCSGQQLLHAAPFRAPCWLAGVAGVGSQRHQALLCLLHHQPRPPFEVPRP